MGGKPDDITAVVAYIVPTSGAQKNGASSPARSSQAASASRQGQALASNEGQEKAEHGSRGPKKSETQECNGGSSDDISIVGTQLRFLEGLGNSPLPRIAMWGSRSSFPPRVFGVTTPAIKASIHSVPKALKAADYRAFEHLKEKAQQRVQTVVSAGPSQNKGGNRWLSEKPATVFNAIRGFFYGK